jgi:4-hydroxy-3-polyprenylbenzoate decarboxylase
VNLIPNAYSVPLDAHPAANAGASAGWPDLRDWLRRVDEIGQLRQLDGADWRKEIGAITEMNCLQAAKSSCLLFDHIKDYPAGWRVVTNSVASIERAALALDLPTGLGPNELVQLWRERRKTLELIPTRDTRDGPVLENVRRGQDIDLGQFPVPIWHEDDGGRYMGTGDMIVTRDPDSGAINVGTYRMMVLDRDKLGLYISPGHHGRLHRDKYFERGERMPVVAVLGMDPLLMVAGSLPLPLDMNEYEWAGGVRGRPVDVIRGEVTGLPFPANAEIVVEGFVDPQHTLAEGPFGEWTGYYASAQRQETYVQVEALYYRNQPILLGAPPMKPPSDHSEVNDIVRFAGIWEALEAAGVPDVRGVGRLPVAGNGMLVVSIRQRYAGHAKQAALIAGQSLGAAYLGRYVVVVDEDIDPFNTNDVLWAIWSRADPEESIDLVRNCWSTPLDPRIPPEKRARRDFTNSRLIIDATRPFHWRDQFPKTVGTPANVQAAIRDKWGLDLFR